MKKIQIIIFSLSVIVAAHAQTESASAFDVDGVKVIYRPTTKHLVTVSIYFRGGVSNYEIGKDGIERLAVDGALQCGTAKYSYNAFEDSMDTYGLNITAGAGRDEAHISLYCTDKYFDKGWDLLAQAVTNPVFNKQDFINVQQQALTSVKQEEGNPDEALSAFAMKNAFAGTPYAISPVGTEVTIENLSAEDIKAYYYKTLLIKSRMFVVVAGNIPREEIAAKLHEAFKSIPAGDYKQAALETPEITGNSVVLETRELATNYIMGIMNAPSYASSDYIPFRMAMSFLKGRLFYEIRSKRNLSYAPSAYIVPGLMPYCVVYVSTTNPKAAVEVMTKEIQNARRDYYSSDNLDDVKGLYLTNSYINAESTDAIAEGLAMAELQGSWKRAEELPSIIYNTTGKEMKRAFKKYIGGIKWFYLGDANLASQATEAFQEPVE